VAVQSDFGGHDGAVLVDHDGKVDPEEVVERSPLRNQPDSVLRGDQTRPVRELLLTERAISSVHVSVASCVGELTEQDRLLLCRYRAVTPHLIVIGEIGGDGSASESVVLAPRETGDDPCFAQDEVVGLGTEREEWRLARDARGVRRDRHFTTVNVDGLRSEREAGYVDGLVRAGTGRHFTATGDDEGDEQHSDELAQHGRAP